MTMYNITIILAAFGGDNYIALKRRQKERNISLYYVHVVLKLPYMYL